MQEPIEEQTDQDLGVTPFWAEFVEPIERDRQAEALAVSTCYCDYDGNDGDVLYLD